MKKLILCVVIFLSFHSPAYAPADVTEVVVVEETQTEPEIEGEWVLMNVSAIQQDTRAQAKTPGPLIRITTAGKPVKEWHTLAVGPSIPFGTKITYRSS